MVSAALPGRNRKQGAESQHEFLASLGDFDRPETSSSGTASSQQLRIESSHGQVRWHVHGKRNTDGGMVSIGNLANSQRQTKKDNDTERKHQKVKLMMKIRVYHASFAAFPGKTTFLADAVRGYVPGRAQCEAFATCQTSSDISDEFAK